METTVKNRGLTNFDLKIIGMLLMVVDHVGYFFQLPVWTRMLGRLAAPIFLFMAAEGFYHTSNRKKYIGQMYLFALITSVGNTILTRTFPDPEGRLWLIGNIFFTLAIALSIMGLIENIKGKKHVIISVIGIVLLIILSVIAEGGPIYVAIAVFFYLFRDKRGLKFGVFIGISLVIGLLPVIKGIVPLSSLVSGTNYEWMKVFSLIFLVPYNGDKGRKMNKYFFYVFYPLHMWLLFFISQVIL